jgi:SAM-dependent methyltransferase
MQSTEILRWKLDPSLEREIAQHYKSKLAPSFTGRGAHAISQEFTFDESAPKLTFEEISSLLNYVDRGFLSGGIKGIGLELGGGPATIASLIANFPSVTKMYSMDACAAIVELAPEVISELSPEHGDKVIPCVGEFNNIELPDSSADFLFDFFSLHHSDDITKTFKELARVLKPGGIVICLDKARSDALTDADIQALLDIEYDDKAKTQMHVPLDSKHTRRMNGEFEYRLREWKSAFLGAGFTGFEHFNLARPVSGNPAVRFAKRAFAKIPPRIQARVSKMLVPIDKPGVPISADHRVYTPLVNHFPKEISLMIATK